MHEIFKYAAVSFESRYNGEGTRDGKTVLAAQLKLVSITGPVAGKHSEKAKPSSKLVVNSIWRHSA